MYDIATSIMLIFLLAPGAMIVPEMFMDNTWLRTSVHAVLFGGAEALSPTVPYWVWWTLPIIYLVISWYFGLRKKTT